MAILAIFIVLLVLAALFTLHLIRVHARDDEKLKFYKDKRTKASLLSRTDDKLVFAFDVPYRNTGTHEAIFLDAFVRVYLPDEQYNGALVRGRVNHPAAPRTDDYFEARLVPGGEAGRLTAAWPCSITKKISCFLARNCRPWWIEPGRPKGGDSHGNPGHCDP